MPLIWIVLVSKSFCNGANIITNYQIIFVREKFFEFIVEISKETYFIVLVEKILPFYLKPKSSVCFLDKFKSRTRSLRSPCVKKWGSDEVKLASNVGSQSTLSPFYYP